MQPGPQSQELLLSPTEATNAHKTALDGKTTFKIKKPWKGNFELVSIEDEETKISRVFVLDTEHSIGRGAQGEVFLAQEVFENKELNKIPENLIIFKRSHEKLEISTDLDFKNEYEILKHLKRLNGFFRVNERFCLLSELCPGKNLADFCYDRSFPVWKKRNLSKEIIYKLASAILKAIDEFHQVYGVLHRDIKLENIRIEIKDNGEFVARLVDFGDACFIQKATKLFRGTHGYQAWEMYQDSKEKPVYNLQTEYFSVGMLLAELASTFNFENYRKSEFKEWQQKLDARKFTPDIAKEALKVGKIFPDLNSHMKELSEFIFFLTAENFYQRPVFTDIQAMFKKLDKMVSLEAKAGMELPEKIEQKKERRTSSPDVDSVLAGLSKMHINAEQIKGDARVSRRSMYAPRHAGLPKFEESESSKPTHHRKRSTSLTDEERTSIRTTQKPSSRLSRRSIQLSPSSQTVEIKRIERSFSDEPLSANSEDNELIQQFKKFNLEPVSAPPVTKSYEAKRHSKSPVVPPLPSISEKPSPVPHRRDSVMMGNGELTSPRGARLGPAPTSEAREKKSTETPKH